MKSTILLVTAVLGLSLVACKKEEPAPAPAKAQAAQVEVAAVAPPKAPALAPNEPTTAVDGLATAEDFEDEASKTVAVDNLETELDRLEAEISGF